MKTLLLLRHAKASRDDADLPDHNRPLTDRGKKDAKRLGRQLHDAKLVPDLIISSTARRARKTASKVAKQTNYPRAIELTDRLYLSTPQEHLEVLRSVPDGEACIMLVGHNPGLSQFVSELTDTDTELATAELVQLELPIKHWSEIAKARSAKLKKVWQAAD